MSTSIRTASPATGRAVLLLLGATLLGGRALVGDPLPGWPARLGTTAACFSPPAAGDVDGDGDLEILATVGNPLGMPGGVEGLYAFHHDGSELADGDNDPTTVGLLVPLEFSPSFLRTPVTLGNLDGDPELEILCLSRNGVHAFDGDGQPLPGWPVAFPPSLAIDAHNAMPIVVADVDADGSNEVLFTSGDTAADPELFTLHLLRADGSSFSPSWPLLLERDSFGATVYAGLVADLVDRPGREGHLEIVVGSHPTANAAHRILAVDTDGRLVWRVEIAAADFVGADLDGDGRIEIVAIEAPWVEGEAIVTSLVRLDGEDGERLGTYRIPIGRHVDVFRWQPPDFLERDTRGYVGAHPINDLQPDVLSIGFVDGDARPDVVVSTRFLDQTARFVGGVDELLIHEHRGRIHAVDLVDEVALPGFPIELEYGTTIAPVVLAPERLIDLDGDGRVELLASDHPSTFEKRLVVFDSGGVELFTDSLLATTPGTFILELVLRRGVFGDFDGDGRLDYGSNLRRGELHLETFGAPAPAFDPAGGWTDYRADVQRTGVFRP